MQKQHLIKEFSILSFDQKKEKVIQLLNGIKEADMIFMKALKYIKTVEVDTDFLNTMYIDIIELGESIIQGNNLKNREILQQRIKKIKQKEAEEKDKEVLDFNF